MTDQIQVMVEEWMEILKRRVIGVPVQGVVVDTMTPSGDRLEVKVNLANGVQFGATFYKKQIDPPVIVFPSVLVTGQVSPEEGAKNLHESMQMLKEEGS